MDIVPDTECTEDHLADVVVLVPVAGPETENVPAKEILPIDFGLVVHALLHYPVVVDAAEEENLVLRLVDMAVGSPVEA